MVAKFISLFLLCYQLYHPGMTVMFLAVDVAELSSSSLLFFHFYNYYFLSIFTHRWRYFAVKCYLNQYSGSLTNERKVLPLKWLEILALLNSRPKIRGPV